MSPPNLSSYSDAPIYNTKAVVQKTGIPAATLRAWERRYGVPLPARTESNYRLYSERDVALIRWLRARVDEGITMGQAVDLYKRIRAGQDVPAPLVREADEAADRPLNPSHLQERLITAFQSFDERAAGIALSEAFAAHPLDRVCTGVIRPVMERIGELWHEGVLSVPVEHFATAFVERKLLSLVDVQPPVTDGPPIVTGCATFEQHRLGILLLSLFLRRAGHRVVYLGANLPVRELENVLRGQPPAMVALSASTLAALPSLREFGTSVDIQTPRPLYLVGGRLFREDPGLVETIPNARLLGSTNGIEDMVREVNLLLGQHPTE